MEINTELIAKARTAKSPEEVLALAKENGIEQRKLQRCILISCILKQASLTTTSWTMWRAAAATRRADASRRPAGIDASISHKDSHLSVSRVPVHNAAIGASIRIASAVLFGVRF